MEQTFWIKFADYIENPLVWLFGAFSVVLIIVFYALSKSAAILKRQLGGVNLTSVVEAKEESAWKKLMKSLTRSVPVEQEKDVMLDHNYDGIRELDNQLPPWWKWGFYITIVIACVYMFVYHVVGNGKVGLNEYTEEMKQAEQAKAERMKNSAGNITYENVTALAEAGEIAAGKSTFEKLCIACHGAQAQGLPSLGPNLTDEYWLHGGGIKNVFHTISEGVPAKGMLTWKTQLSPKQIQQVASYVLTLKGTNPPGAKEPQGDKWTESPDSTTVKEKKVIALK